MKISPILHTTTQKHNFKAGKTQIFSDFDGTYFPYHQNILKEANTHPDVLRMRTMQKKVSDFISAEKQNKISFVITTGRSKAEMQYLLSNIGKNNIFFFSPEYFILRNGLQKCDVKKEENTLNLHKSQDTISCVPKEKLMSDIVNLILSVEPNIKIFSDKINKIEKDYNEQSLEYAYKEEKVENKPYVSINVEDNGLTEIVFPYHYFNVDAVKTKIDKWIEEKQLPFDLKYQICDSEYVIPTKKDWGETYTCEKGHSIILRPKTDSQVNDKLNAPKEAVKKILEYNSNDLVVVAGDGSNDETMLNPLNYLDLFGINIDKSKPIDEILEDKNVIEALKKLPLVPVVAGNGQSLSHILELKQILDRKKIRIIQHAKNPENELLAKIKRGMHEYSDRNDKYKYGLGKKLYTEIIG